MPTIEERLEVRRQTFTDRGMDITNVVILLDGKFFHEEAINHSHMFSWNYLTPYQFAQQVLSKIKEEWTACDQTLNSEPQYRKTIISSCGQLQVNLQPL